MALQNAVKCRPTGTVNRSPRSVLTYVDFVRIAVIIQYLKVTFLLPVNIDSCQFFLAVNKWILSFGLPTALESTYAHRLGAEIDARSVSLLGRRITKGGILMQFTGG
ncbi:hypothetical protein WAI453_011335 [Rhynchosporium graminicola]